ASLHREIGALAGAVLRLGGRLALHPGDLGGGEQRASAREDHRDHCIFDSMPYRKLRDTNLTRLVETRFDALVLGGGITGVVSAAALAARGARVALIDRGDFASVTSQQSSNLAWGGIKYLETYEFGLLRKLGRARNKLIRSYPSTVQEIRFLMSHEKSFRHGRWILMLGAWLYWVIGSFFTRRPRLLSVADIERDEPIVQTNGLDGGFEY